jgi:hypothetical protein
MTNDKGLTNFRGLSQESLQAESFGSGSKSPSQNLIANCELRIANWFNCADLLNTQFRVVLLHLDRGKGA